MMVWQARVRLVVDTAASAPTHVGQRPRVYPTGTSLSPSPRTRARGGAPGRRHPGAAAPLAHPLHPGSEDRASGRRDHRLARPRPGVEAGGRGAPSAREGWPVAEVPLLPGMACRPLLRRLAQGRAGEAYLFPGWGEGHRKATRGGVRDGRHRMCAARPAAHMRNSACESGVPAGDGAKYVTMISYRGVRSVPPGLWVQVH